MIQTAIKDALKEWAVTIKALDEGKQVLLLRKGGIREKEFRVEHEEFLLYPTYEHQKAELLKPEYRDGLAITLASWGGETPREQLRSVSFTHFAQVVEVIETMDPDKVPALAPHYIWTADYAEKRLYWRPKKPLEIILVRVSRLEQPATIPVEDYFNGCRSWVELPSGIPLGALQPVISNERFEEMADAVREVLR